VRLCEDASGRESESINDALGEIVRRRKRLRERFEH